MTSQSTLRLTLCCVFTAALFLITGQLGADIVIGQKTEVASESAGPSIAVIEFLEPESTNLLHFNESQKPGQAELVMPYSLASVKALAAPIPEPAHWPFLIFCMLIWAFVHVGRSGRLLRHAT